MSDGLFDIEEIPLVHVARTPAVRKSAGDARFRGEYPPEWDSCPPCRGTGRRYVNPDMDDIEVPRFETCDDCKGMGSVKARVRLEAGHRCLRCKHPYVPKDDAKKLGVAPSWREGGWSACDTRCAHGGPVRALINDEWEEHASLRVLDYPGGGGVAGRLYPRHLLESPIRASEVEAAWRVLTVHHLDGHKANLAWWNLVPLCQRCHLEIQAKVVMERVYPHEHSEWFKDFVAGYYAAVYLGEDLTREQVRERRNELLALELGS